MTSYDDAVIEGACASIGHPIRKGETFGEWFERTTGRSRLGNGGDYGIMPQPTDAQAALDRLAETVLGPGWHVASPMCGDQANTCCAVEVARKSCSRTRCPFRRQTAW